MNTQFALWWGSVVLTRSFEKKVVESTERFDKIGLSPTNRPAVHCGATVSLVQTWSFFLLHETLSCMHPGHIRNLGNFAPFFVFQYTQHLPKQLSPTFSPTLQVTEGHFAVLLTNIAKEDSSVLFSRF